MSRWLLWALCFDLFPWDTPNVSSRGVMLAVVGILVTGGQTGSSPRGIPPPQAHTVSPLRQAGRGALCVPLIFQKGRERPEVTSVKWQR